MIRDLYKSSGFPLDTEQALDSVSLPDPGSCRLGGRYCIPSAHRRMKNIWAVMECQNVLRNYNHFQPCTFTSPQNTHFKEEVRRESSWKNIDFLMEKPALLINLSILLYSFFGRWVIRFDKSCSQIYLQPAEDLHFIYITSE